MEFVTDSPPLDEALVERWEIPAEPARKNQVIDAIIAYLSRDGELAPSTLFRYRLCLDEALTNAITHGSPGVERPVTVDFHCGDSSWAVRVQDHGPGFGPEDIPDPNAPGAELLESGRGITILDRFSDSLIIARGGREVVIAMNLEELQR